MRTGERRVRFDRGSKLLRAHLTRPITSAGVGLLVALAVAAGIAGPAHANSDGVLPMCPTSLTVQELAGSPPPTGVIRGGTSGGAGPFNAQITRGLARVPPCASGDFVVPPDLDSPECQAFLPTCVAKVAHGVTASASPSSIHVPADGSPTVVRFDVIPAGAKGPLTAGRFPECFPWAANTSCTGPPRTSLVAVRPGSNDLKFDGQWGVVQSTDQSPVEFHRIGTCPPPAVHGVEPTFYDGTPCSYQLQFQGNPDNDLPMQVIVSTSWSGDFQTLTAGDGSEVTGPNQTAQTLFSMVLLPPEVPNTPDPDSDADGLHDSIDACPSDSDLAAPRNPRTGCPADPIVDLPPKATAGDDSLLGDGLANVICGLAGNDKINGGGGNDKLFGDACGVKAKRAAGAGGGNDTLNGDAGNDVLYGAGGNDKLNGGAGDDKLTGGRGVNKYAGGAGNDTIAAKNGKKETVDCGAGKKDKATVDKHDKVRGCEKVKRARR